MRMMDNEERYYDGDGDDRIKLTPSPNGEDCIGNGLHEGVEIRCDECDFYLECFPTTKGA